MITWMPSAQSVSNTCHFALGWAIVFTAAYYGVHPFYCFLLVLLWALPKEFIFDIIIEKDEWSSSLNDFAWYMVGGLSAMGLLQWKLLVLALNIW